MRPRASSSVLGNRTSHWRWLLATLVLLTAGALLTPACAQQPAADKILTPAELADVVGPIALYPDDLVGIVLPASTYPLQIVEAGRFLEKRKQDPSQKPGQDWDDSVVALLNYPEVVHLLSDDLDWTWDLGTAVLNQRPDVLDAIQAFRVQARNAGNLRTDEHQKVTTGNDGSVVIVPADPQVIYVPYYEPEQVVVHQTMPVFAYYPWAYPVYYYPYPAGYVFRTGFFFGVTSFFDIGWHSRLLHVHYYGHDDFPYFGYSYYSPYYVRNYLHVNISAPRGGFVWEPRHRYGDRPKVPIVRGREGRVADSRMPEPPRSGGAAGSASRYRVPPAPAPAESTGSPTAPRRTEARQPNREGASGGYRSGGGMSQSSRRNESGERLQIQPPRATPARPQTDPRDGGVRYRVPAEPNRQQQSRPSLESEYRGGMSSASRYAPPPRAESGPAPQPRAEMQSAPRGGGESRGDGSYRNGGGGGRSAHPGGGRGSEGRGDGR